MAIRLLLYLLLAHSLLDGSASLKFASKIFHRYSDEARAFWVSRNGGNWVESWPKRNSLNYFKLLLSHDLNRKKMKLASNYDFLFPSEGSETLFFGNILYSLHYTWIDVGTPNISFLVALDAGSDLFWVPCDCIQCAPLSAGSYGVLDKDLNEYSPSLSSTSKHLSCSHQLCELHSICKSPEDPCPYIAQYTSENTSSSGFLIEDMLHLSSIGKHEIQSSVQASVIIGCGRKQTGGYLDGAAPDGVMGLGLGNISVPSLLANTGLIQNSFSICFDENNSGRILFGDKGVASQHSTPFVPIEGEYVTYFVGVERFCVGNYCSKQSGFLALIDSGSSFTYLPTEVYRRFVSQFDKKVNATRITLAQSPWKYCYRISLQDLPNLPTMRLVLATNQTFLIRNPMFIEPVNQEIVNACLTLLHNDDDYGTIGQNFMTGYNMVFDRENMQFGWSNSNCKDHKDKRGNPTPPPNDGSPTQLPTNDQQSIPGSHGVAPAVAGRASSEPSSAMAGRSPIWLCLLSSLSLACLHYFQLCNLSSRL